MGFIACLQVISSRVCHPKIFAQGNVFGKCALLTRHLCKAARHALRMENNRMEKEAVDWPSGWLGKGSEVWEPIKSTTQWVHWLIFCLAQWNPDCLLSTYENMCICHHRSKKQYRALIPSSVVPYFSKEGFFFKSGPWLDQTPVVLKTYEMLHVALIHNNSE